MTFAVGSLVKARGREWVVLPESETDLLVLRPLGGSEDDITGIYLPLEPVEQACFDLPDPGAPGDYYSCNLLRNAVRLGFRSSAGPFRSFGRLAVDPRPYQLVPLLIALKQDPVRILIADDVGIGKTIEAGLVARELIDRGEVQRLAVLCPPPLAEQWQMELRDKFHIHAELVLTSTVSRLERNLRVGRSLFEHYPFVIVSTDFIKSDRRRHEFFRTCPELVIVDEAHTCAFAGEGKGLRHQRHRLVSGLARDENRHLILVTATPHSGKEEAFRSLLVFLKPKFSNLPKDLSGQENEHHRRRLAEHFVQRKRADIKEYLGSETVFPERSDQEESYRLSAEYKKAFERAIQYVRQSVETSEGGRFQQRVRWWSALALLRAMASSPAAAAATLRNRAAVADAETLDQVDELGRKSVLDLFIDDAAETLDVAPGCDVEDPGDSSERRRLLRLARDVEKLSGPKDIKLTQAVKIIKDLVNEDFQPIVFCRFVQTAHYVNEALRKSLPKNVEVTAVTGMLPPKEREDRVKELSQAPRRVLVCTDCLSEGINLQEHFNAVFHYDLSWNPTRHEQREGRVDRFGQQSPVVRVMTFYGIDNQIDGIVLDVLLRKHQTIRNSLGISVPVPFDTNQVVEAIFEGLLLKEKPQVQTQLILPGFEKHFEHEKAQLYKLWDAVANREKRSRTMFAQQTIKVEEVWQELKAVQETTGAGADLETFVQESLAAYGAIVSRNGVLSVDLKDPEIPEALREIAGNDQLKVCFNPSFKEGAVYLNRTHPMVEGIAGFVMENAFDGETPAVAKRSGVMSTYLVQRRTTLLLVRFRYHIITRINDIEQPLLAEDCQVLGFEGTPSKAEWISPDQIEALIKAKPDENVLKDKAVYFLEKLVQEFDALWPYLDQAATANGEKLLDAHRRVRRAARRKGVQYRIEPHLPADILGTYIYLPARES